MTSSFKLSLFLLWWSLTGAVYKFCNESDFMTGQEIHVSCLIVIFLFSIYCFDSQNSRKSGRIFWTGGYSPDLDRLLVNSIVSIFHKLLLVRV